MTIAVATHSQICDGSPKGSAVLVGSGMELGRVWERREHSVGVTPTTLTL